MLWPAFHFHSVLLIFVNLWPISALCVADMVHAVADVVCGRYHRFPHARPGADCPSPLCYATAALTQGRSSTGFISIRQLTLVQLVLDPPCSRRAPQKSGGVVGTSKFFGTLCPSTFKLLPAPLIGCLGQCFRISRSDHIRIGLPVTL